jgi:hypothetical protein
MNYTKLAKKLIHARETLRLTVREASAKSGVGEGEIAFVEVGRGAGPATLKALARAYKLDLVELMILAGHLTRKDVTKHQELKKAA